MAAHLARLAEETYVVPAVNQIEVHPYFGNELDDASMLAITALDKSEDGRTGPNPDEFDYIPD